MARPTLIRDTFLAVAIAACSFVVLQQVAAADRNIPVIEFTGSDATSRFVTLGI
jgi:hypothetical protein